MRTLTKRQKDIALVILASLFFALLASYSWFQLYAPAREANARAVSALADQREVIFELQRQVAAKPIEQSSSSLPLQRKVPVLPLEDSILLQLEKAEVKSNTLIRNVAFNKDDLEEGSTELTEGEQPVMDPALAPSQLTIDVELTAASYKEMDRFIREVETMERIFVVQAIELEAPEEVREASAESEPIQLTLSFQAFYRPDLVELQPEVPKLDAPMPAGKEDPTARAGDDE
ncbi:pilus assembly protein PilO [Sporosarcina sp. A2]|uniref:pilus assembly protein PilO n=1 Tax=Sporosarcina sp. A2 TaxID=3393449 RepID=UPI003D7AD64B